MSTAISHIGFTAFLEIKYQYYRRTNYVILRKKWFNMIPETLFKPKVELSETNICKGIYH